MARLKHQKNILLATVIVIFIYYTFSFNSIMRRFSSGHATNPETQGHMKAEQSHSHGRLSASHMKSLKYATSDKDACQVITLAWKCKGEKEAMQIFWSLKTILYYRTTALKFHIFADEIAFSILQVMFETWELPCAEVVYHSYASEQKNITMILDKENEGVIHLSTTMRFLADIKELYEVVESQNVKLFNLNNSQLPQMWSVKPELKDLIDISHPEEMKAFSSEPAEDIHIANPAVMARIEELFEVLKLDGNIFRHPHIPNCICTVHSKIVLPHSNISLVKECSRYTEYAYTHKRTLLYNLGSASSKIYQDIDVSVVTQLTFDRMHILERFVTMWSGPMVVVIYITDLEAFKLKTWLRQSGVFKKRKNIDIHLVFKRKHLYPINQLRNVGIEHVRTPYCLFVDIDLLPNPSIYEDLKKYIKQYLVNEVNKTIIIPAFEAFDDLKPMPANKTMILKSIAEKKVDGFKMSRKWNLGHKPTDYPRWMKANESYIVKWRDAYEPYVVLKTSEMPRYEPALLERMGDKIAYGLHLYAKGSNAMLNTHCRYEFRVLSDVFVIHMPHPTSEGTSLWKNEHGYFSCSAKLFQAFKRDIFKIYPSKRY